VDGDGIGYRTLPGNKHPSAAYFARGTGHNEFGRYSEDPKVWEANLLRLRRKIKAIRGILPKPEIHSAVGARIGVIGFGSTNPAIREAIEILREQGIIIDYLRLKALPAADEVKEFIEKHQRNYVVELNRDGQLKIILQAEFPEDAVLLRSLAHLDGLPLSAAWLVNALKEQEEIE
jgi:2-oxoglutarate ferredoxin oxidoreductase subunit alpha